MGQIYSGHGTYISGHMAGGNLHVLVKAGEGSEQDHREVNNLLYGIIRDLQGSVSAEHGIGLGKLVPVNARNGADKGTKTDSGPERNFKSGQNTLIRATNF